MITEALYRLGTMEYNIPIPPDKGEGNQEQHTQKSCSFWTPGMNRTKKLCPETAHYIKLLVIPGTG